MSFTNRPQVEPLSWFCLERYVLGELSTNERASVEHALNHSPENRSRLQWLQRQTEVLRWTPPAAAPPRPNPPRRWNLLPEGGWGWAPLGLVAAAALLLWLQTPTEPNRVKGDGVTLSLTRWRGGTTQRDARQFASGDRFRVQVACAPPQLRSWRFAVYQEDAVFYPLGPGGVVDCVNHGILPGAFSLSGAASLACVAIDTSLPESRKEAVLQAEADFDVACVALVPQAESR